MRLRVSDVGCEVGRVAMGARRVKPAARGVMHADAATLFDAGLTAKDLGAAIGTAPADHTLHAVCTARVRMHDVIIAAADAMGGDVLLWLISWSVSPGPVEALSAATAGGFLRRMRVLSSDRYQQLALSDKRAKVAFPEGTRVRTSPIHAKLFVLWSPKRHTGLVCCTSANLNNNKMHETYVATTTRAAVLFYLRWFGICWKEGGEWRLENQA